ncbi:MAG TPA: glycosyltransferase family 4 protein [Stellaceae bacterium]|jgi:phosphatidylinositol alpha-1,6-mannosyltransferase
MNILALVGDAFGGHGGIAQYNRDLFTALKVGGCAERIVVLPRQGRAGTPEPPDRVRQLGPRGKSCYPLAALRAAVAEGPFDVMFCGHLNLAPLAAMVSRLIGVPLWLQLHGWEAWEPTRAQAWAARHSTLITAVSRYTRRRFIRSVAIDPQRIRVLPNTVDEKFTPGPPPPSLVERYRLQGRRVLLTVGRLSPDERGKGHDKVIGALPQLIADHPDLVYLVVGDGGDRQRLAAAAKEGGVADHVLFAGAVASDELADHYRLATVFVMPSIQEGFGIAFLEAAGSGLIAIGGNRDGSVDPLADGAAGMIVDPTSPMQLVAAIESALAGQGPDPAQARRFRFENFGGHLRDLVTTHLLPPRVEAA